MGLFNIFSKKQKRLTTPVDLSIVGCDIHSHFIPGIDDGAKTLEESVQMVSELYKLGYKKIITSPHTMSDYYRNTAESILSGSEKVKEALKEQNIPIEFDAVSEYYLDYDFERKLDEEKLLTFGNKHLLFFKVFMPKIISFRMR